MRRTFLLALASIILIIPLWAHADFLVNSLCADPAGDFSMQMKVSLTEWMPLDDVRCSQLSDLLDHVSIRVSRSADQYDLSADVDHMPAVLLHLKEEESRELLGVSTVPGTVFSSQEDVLSSLLFDDSDFAAHDFSFVRDICMMNEFRTMVDWTVHSDAILKAEKADSQKVVGYGNTTRRILVSLTEEAFAAIANSKPEASLSGFLSSVSLSGTQKFYVLADDSDEIHKISYTGAVETDSGIWKVDASWKTKETEAYQKDAVHIEASKRVSQGEKSHKRIWSLERETDGQKETWEYVLTDKTGNTQTVRRFSCELSLEDAHITGSCEIQESNKSKGKNGKLLCLTPDLSVSDADSALEGTIGFRYTYDQQNPFSGTVSIRAFSEAAADFPDASQIIDADALDEDELALWKSRLIDSSAGALLRALVLIDPGDTLYLRQGLEESEWIKILLTAGPVVEED